MKTKLILLSLMFLTSACASINSVSLTPIPPDRKTPVKLEKSKVIILGFNFDNDFVDELVDGLKSQCPNGRVSGILTKDEDINYFLYFVWKKQITVTGYCVSAAGSATAKPTVKKRGTASESEPVTLEEPSL
jgi:hypothetical protein